MTNFEKIKSMSIEEMADFFSYYIEKGFCFSGDCYYCSLNNESFDCKSINELLESEVE